MRIKSLFLIAAVPTLMIGCASEPEENLENEVVQSEVTHEDEPENEEPPVEVLTIEGMLDGPDQWFYTYKEGIDDYDDLPVYSEVHIIPHWDSEKIFDGMIGLNDRDFRLNSPYDKTTGTVKVFYTRDKSMEMISYSLVNGKPDGMCTIYDPEGEVFISKEYENGLLKKSYASPHSVDWTFDQETGKLSVSDTDWAFDRQENGDLFVSLMPSIHDEEGDNSLYDIMQKESFKHPISVNGELITGRLYAFFNPKGVGADLYYRLGFTDGILDGEVKVYNDWGDLELHEVFNQGVLDTTVYKINYDEMDGLAKPIIYLYPEEEQVVEVKLKVDGSLTHTYPKYEDGWKVTALPDGTLYDEKGKEFYALYWEGQNNTEFTLNEGAVVKGDESVEFLEKALKTLGLTRREANEFIVYWLPQLERSPYNLIHFSTEEYEKMAELEITPKPETLIRVMMVFRPLEKPIMIREQNLKKLARERKGFTVVEWGGSKIEFPVLL